MTNEVNADIPAFPQVPAVHNGQLVSLLGTAAGMTLRDYFAAKALQGMLADPDVDPMPELLPKLANVAYQISDAMLQERTKK